MASDEFSGFDEWLDFRVKAALASIEGHSKGRHCKTVRARPLSSTSSVHGLWVLSDGEHPPVPFLFNSASGGSGSILGKSTDDAFEYGSAWCDDKDVSLDHYNDWLVELIAKELNVRCNQAGVGSFDLMLNAPLLIHPMCASEPEKELNAHSDSEVFQDESIEWYTEESFENAWTRCFSTTDGPATRHIDWRVFQGEKLIKPSLTARAVTTLYDKDTDPGFECEVNCWGQTSSKSISLWLIEVNGVAPFLFSRDERCTPCHSIDELESVTCLSAKGVSLWTEKCNINDDSRDDPNIFSELHARLPEIKQSGFGFILGESVKILLDPVFERDAKAWLELISKPWADEEKPLPLVWACIDAQQISQACSSSTPSIAIRHRLQL